MEPSRNCGERHLGTERTALRIERFQPYNSWTCLSQRIRSGLVTAVWFAIGIGCAVAVTPPVFDLSIVLGFELDYLRTFRRMLLLGAVLVVAFRLLPWRDGNLHSYGLSFSRESVSRMVPAYLIAAVVIAALIEIYMSAGWVRWNLRPDYISRAVRYGLTGFVVAFLEELFFRGWMLRRIKRSKGLLVALIWTNLAYGMAHAFRPRHVTVNVDDTWQGALIALGLWLRHLFSPTFAPSIAGLFLFGLVLSALYLRSGSLWPAVGVHAAAVLMLHGVVPSIVGASPPRWAGTKLMYDGLPGWLLMGTAALVIWRMHAGTIETERTQISS